MWSTLAPLLTSGGIGSVVLILVLTGRLVPLRSHLRELELTRALAAAKQEKIEFLQAALKDTTEQRDNLLGITMATAKVVQAIPQTKDTVS